MEWQVIVALVVFIPVILLPVAFIWFINGGGMQVVAREWAKRKAAREKKQLAPEVTDI